MSGGYRMVPSVRLTEDGTGVARWTPAGDEMGATGWRAPRVAGFLVMEAMAQCAGLLLNASSGGRWLLAAVGHADIPPFRWDVPVTLTATAGVRRGRFADVSVAAAADGGGPVAHVGLRMASLDEYS